MKKGDFIKFGVFLIIIGMILNALITFLIISTTGIAMQFFEFLFWIILGGLGGIFMNPVSWAGIVCLIVGIVKKG